MASVPEHSDQNLQKGGPCGRQTTNKLYTTVKVIDSVRLRLIALHVCVEYQGVQKGFIDIVVFVRLLQVPGGSLDSIPRPSLPHTCLLELHVADRAELQNNEPERQNFLPGRQSSHWQGYFGRPFLERGTLRLEL